MLNDINTDKIYLACGATDLRRSIDGLAATVKECFDLDPFSQSIFVFCNRQKDKMKILRWDHNGFWLYYRRLEQGRFQWPEAGVKGDCQVIDHRQLRWLLDGLSLSQPRAHREMKARVLA